jgi:hypothetical protein
MLSYLLPVVASAALLSATASAGEQEADLSLEPCINGGVSQDGTAMYETAAARRAAAEREHDARMTAFQDRLALEMEACINGSVSASGTHVSQSLEDAARYFADGTVYSDDPNYVFMIEGQIIAPAHLVRR